MWPISVWSAFALNTCSVIAPLFSMQIALGIAPSSRSTLSTVFFVCCEQGQVEEIDATIPAVAEGPVNSTHAETGNNPKEGSGSMSGSVSGDVSGDVSGEEQPIVSTNDQKGEKP